MASFNKVYLIGNLTRDPELRYTPSGVAVVNLRLAVNRRYKDKSGENKEEACFVTVVAWDRQAEVCNQYLKKGRMVFVEGRLQSRTWETADGQKRNVLDIRAEMVQFLSPAKAGETVASGAASAEMPAGGDTTMEETKPQIPKVENVSWDEEEKSE